jgi:hypothetical protein
MVVVGVQYAIGLGIGVVGYVLPRRAGLPGWCSTFAMVPVLLSAYAGPGLVASESDGCRDAVEVRAL